MIEETTTKAITCKNCGSNAVVKFGSYKGVQRYWCKSCQRKFKADADIFHERILKVLIDAMVADFIALMIFGFLWLGTRYLVFKIMGLWVFISGILLCLLIGLLFYHLHTLNHKPNSQKEYGSGYEVKVNGNSFPRPEPICQPPKTTISQNEAQNTETKPSVKQFHFYPAFLGRIIRGGLGRVNQKRT
jgi:hypothetical protein